MVAQKLVHPSGGIRNPRFRTRVWILKGRVGTMLQHVGDSPVPSSRGLRPQTPQGTYTFEPTNDSLISDLEKLVLQGLDVLFKGFLVAYWGAGRRGKEVAGGV